MPTPKKKPKPKKVVKKPKPGECRRCHGSGALLDKRTKKTVPCDCIKARVAAIPICINCPDCKGAGSLGFDVPFLCPRCGGVGLVSSTRPEGAPLPQGGGVGRTPKHTPELLALIAGAISKGLTNAQAADLAEIALSTLEAWMNDPQFSGPLRKARSERLLLRLGLLEGRVENWTAIAWLLERAHGLQFAPAKTIQRLEHEFTPGVDEGEIAELEELISNM